MINRLCLLAATAAVGCVFVAGCGSSSSSSSGVDEHGSGDQHSDLEHLIKQLRRRRRQSGGRRGGRPVQVEHRRSADDLGDRQVKAARDLRSGCER